MKYVLLFVLIQLVNIPLMLAGVPICAVLAAIQPESSTHYPKWAWIWDNEIDGVYGPENPHTAWQAFYWTALRNPVNNLRFVPGVSKPGRPLWYRTWVWFGRQFYAKAGWANVTGWPMLSAGGGRGF
jgi:hypothetical protein